jgi:Xaa-Pro aminopeptidase
MPFAEPIHTIPYEDHWNPWTTLYTSPIWTPILSPKIAVDDEIRDFIPRALASTAFSVSGPTHAITSIRQLKTPLETGILRAVNTGTVEAIRATRTCLYPDVTENTVQSVLDATLQAAGLTPFFAIVQFGESAALPHGGYDGRRQLKPEMMVLIDVGAHLYGYSSDVTRTFYAPFAREAGEEESRVWRVVRDAQIAGVKAVVWNGTAAGVDGAAREVVVRAGYGEGFTHRVGHGIGIKAHEGPYLDGGNFGAVLRPGMVFAVEPGVYLVGRFGVRLEDVVLVREDGEAESLSGRFAGSVWDP